MKTYFKAWNNAFLIHKTWLTPKIYSRNLYKRFYIRGERTIFFTLSKKKTLCCHILFNCFSISFSNKETSRRIIYKQTLCFSTINDSRFRGESVIAGVKKWFIQDKNIHFFKVKAFPKKKNKEINLYAKKKIVYRAKFLDSFPF